MIGIQIKMQNVGECLLWYNNSWTLGKLLNTELTLQFKVAEDMGSIGGGSAFNRPGMGHCYKSLFFKIYDNWEKLLSTVDS